MPFSDWVTASTLFADVPPPPPDTPRVFSMVAPAVPAGFTERVRTYNSATEMIDDDWTAGMVAFDAASQLFSQTPINGVSLGQLVIIRRDTAVAEIWTVDIVDTTDATIELLADGVVISSFVAAGNTAEQIKDGLIAGLVASGYTGGTVDTDTLTVTNDNAGVPFALTSTATAGTAPDVGDGPTTPAVGVFQDLSPAFQAKPFWGLMMPGAADFDLDEGRRWVGFDTTSRRSFLFAENSDAGVFDPGDTDNLAAVWRLAQYPRVNLCSHPTVTEYAAAAGVGRIGTTFPGARAWHKLPLSGLLETAVTSTRSSQDTATMIERRMSYTERLEGPTSDLEYLWGRTPSGEFIYHYWAADWWWYTIRATVNAALKSSTGINLDDADLQSLADTVKAAMAPLVAAGVIADDFTVTFIPVADITPGELAIGDYQTTGRITATATITPKLRSLHVAATFNLT